MTDQESEETSDADGAEPAVLSRRALFGLLLALWSAGSLSDTRAIRLCYGAYGYGQFGYGGEEPTSDEE